MNKNIKTDDKLRNECLEYLKHTFLNPTDEMLEYHGGMKPTEEHWNEIPEYHKKYMINLVLGFGQTPRPEYAELLEQYRSKKHSDLSFGILAKQLLGRIK